MLCTPHIILSDGEDEIHFVNATSAYPWPIRQQRLRIEYRRKRDSSSGSGKRRKITRPYSVQDDEFSFQVTELPWADFEILRGWYLAQTELSLSTDGGANSSAVTLADVTGEPMIVHPELKALGVRVEVDFEI